MKKRSDLRQFLLVFLATAAAIASLLHFEVVERVAYAVERGRLRAVQETLPAAEVLSERTRTSRAVADMVAPAVVAIEADFRDPHHDFLGKMGIPFTAENDTASAEDAGQERSQDGDHDDTTQQRIASLVPPPLRQGLGSGFVFDADRGLILTNHHVVEGAQEIRVHLADGRTAIAQVRGVDPEADLAVIHIDAPRLFALSLGDSDAVAVGDEVFAVGNPFGLEGTFSKGIISGVNRRNVRIEEVSYTSFLQTDALISPGNSGGPLVDMRGRAIGVSTAMATSHGRYEGVGFAIPIALVRRVLPGLTDPAMLGIWAGDATYHEWRDELAAKGWSEGYGARLIEVIDDTAAESAGLLADDILLAIDENRIDDLHGLTRVLRTYAAGTRVDVHIWRAGKRMIIRLNLDARRSPPT